MGIVFGSGADFSGMSPEPAFISVVRHKAFLEVNEEGSEAAAATAVVVSRGALQHTPRMTVDRPFFCAICDNRSGAILFMGCVVDPQ
jgi:serpin B